MQKTALRGNQAVSSTVSDAVFPSASNAVILSSCVVPDVIVTPESGAIPRAGFHFELYLSPGGLVTFR